MKNVFFILEKSPSESDKLTSELTATLPKSCRSVDKALLLDVSTELSADSRQIVPKAQHSKNNCYQMEHDLNVKWITSTL